MKLISEDGRVHVGDLWMDVTGEVNIVLEVEKTKDDSCIYIEVVNGKTPGSHFYESSWNFGLKENGEKCYFHTLLSRSINA